MSKAQYPSLSTPGVKQYAPQYITEILIERQEAWHGRRLPVKFWSASREWSKRYRTSLMFVRKFLKLHSEEATIAALLSDEGKQIGHLNNARLVPLVQKHQAKIDKLKSDLENVPAPAQLHEDSKPMKQYGNKTTLSKLRELDGERRKSSDNQSDG